MNKKIKLLIVSCCLLLSAVLVSASIQITHVESIPETLTPTGDGVSSRIFIGGGENASVPITSVHLRSGHYGGG